MRLFGVSLACIRGGRNVFSGVDFSVASGSALLVTGRNGAGKSSLLRMIAGLLPPVDGKIVLEGGGDELSIAEQAHYLGHLDPVKPALSVRENLDFWAAYLGRGKATIDAALEAVGLDELAEIPAAYLSAGQRRRLSVARLIAAPRPVWLLDEPTSSLDRAAQERLHEFMHAHLATGGLIVAATHGPLSIAPAQELRLGEPQTP
jgi:heme exporter protein A